MKSGKITVIMTGGTIGCVTDNSVMNVTNEPVVIKEYKRLYTSSVEFDIVQPFNILSENSRPKLWEKLGEAIRAAAGKNDGIIITHGTDTLSYTAAYVAMQFGGLNIPIVLVSANIPVGESGSNGIYNFSAAVDLIENESIAGVFVLYRDRQNRDIVHLASRLVEADTYTDSFLSYGGCPYGVMENGRFVRFACGINPKAYLLKECSGIDYIPTLDNEVLMLKAYPGIDFSAYTLENRPNAVLVCMYHSGTASVEKGRYSLPEFIKRCRACGTEVYLSCYKSESGSKYATAKEIIEAGGIPLYCISSEAAYVKLVLACNQTNESIRDFMKKNICFEVLSEKTLH